METPDPNDRRTSDVPGNTRLILTDEDWLEEEEEDLMDFDRTMAEDDLIDAADRARPFLDEDEA